MQTFRDWCRDNGREAPFQAAAKPFFVPTEKQAGDKVFSGGKWSVVR